MTIIGNIDETSEGFLWQIGNLFTFTKGKLYNSTKFSFADHYWYLVIQRDNKSTCINIGLKRISPGPPSIIGYSLSIKTLEKDYCRCDFNEVKLEFGHSPSISIPETFIRETERGLPNVNAVFCTFKRRKSTGVKSGIVTGQCSYCEETSDFVSISRHEKKCVNEPIKSPECCDVIPLRNCHQHECHTTKPKGESSIFQDYKNVLLDGRNHDLIFKIGEKEFRAHQDILRARSSVFKSMLDHDMKEKNSGVIDVPDCNPEAMEQFILYVYCGKIETQDQNNMIGLYYIADKYDMQSFKQECSNIIRRSMSNENICNVIQLALNHSDSGLLECCTEYFMSNVLDIMHTVEWQIFLKDNTTVGNELLIKSFEKKNGNMLSPESLSSHMSHELEEDKNYDFKKWQKSKMVFKLCPKCRHPIQNTAGYHYITCVFCFILLCWHCLQTFASDTAVLDHICKVHDEQLF